ncbi:hypothetical protein Tco_0889377 [Tanacetum coccineum]
MGDENPIRTLGDYSKPSHEGYRNTIELPVGNNVVPLRSDTIRLVQNECSFHGLRSEDPNQHLKYFLKLVDSLNLDGENRERTRLNSMASKSIAAISHDEREELRKKRIKSSSKLFSPKYLSPASIKELNKNPSAPKRVYFVNSIIILSKDSDTEEDVTTTSACRCDLGKMARGNKEVKQQGKEEDEMETNVEIKEIEKSKIFIGSFAYEYDFMILEDTTSIIDRCLGEMVFGRPFIDKTRLVYDKEEGTVSFKQDSEEIKFNMPHTMEIFKQTRFMGVSTDSIPPLAYEENFNSGRTHYYQSLLIGDEYRQDEENRRGIRHLMRLEKEMIYDKGEVT